MRLIEIDVFFLTEMNMSEQELSLVIIVGLSSKQKQNYFHLLNISLFFYYFYPFSELVVARYSWEENLKHLILSIIIPNVLFAVSIGVLSYWYCPCCEKACHKNPRVYAEFPSAKEK